MGPNHWVIQHSLSFLWYSPSSPQMVSRTENIDDCLLGANASAEVQDEGCESSTVSGVDIVLNHKLQETSFTKDSYKGYIKDYMKAWVF